MCTFFRLWGTGVVCCMLLGPSGQAQTPHGYDYFETRGGLERFFERCEKGGEIRVAFLGGSITQMNGWRNIVMANLQNRFPSVKYDFVAAGIASMGTTPGAFRLERDAFSKGSVDLLFVEAAVNDSTNGRSAAEQTRGMEGIVRRAKQLNPEIDFVMMHFVDPEKMSVYRDGRTPDVIKNHETVANYYGVPSINLAREVTERIAAGEFTWERDFKDLHPAPFGHELYARTIERFLMPRGRFVRRLRIRRRSLPPNSIHLAM